MKRSYLLKKRISNFATALGLLVVKAFARLYNLIFAKRTILFVTNEKIRSITLGPILQACIFLSIAWIFNLFMQSLRYDEVISTKSEEISRLKSVNSYFKEEFETVNEKLRKVNEYLVSVTGSHHSVKASEQDIRQPKSFKEQDLSKRDKHTLNQVKDAKIQLANIQVIAKERIRKIEGAIAITGLSVKKAAPKVSQSADYRKIKELSLNNKSDLTRFQGGPLEEDKFIDAAVAANQVDDDLERHLEKIQFTNEIDYLMVLEKLITVMPLSRPMKDYYVSSGFGKRTDPITRRLAVHRGLDFVGVTNAKIISPSQGKVILAGKFSNYGNAVVIDHGFGITTRYGHLSAVKVTEGQIVKKGDVIALQGNTGRSVGPHLHYEVRYKNIPLNPKRFLEAGETMFNYEKNTKYVDS